MFDARIVGIAVGADDVSSLVDAEQIGKSEICAPIQVFIVEAGLKTGHDRAAGADVVANLLALAIAEHGDVRQQERAIFAQLFRVETVFMDEVESKAAA